MSPGEKSFALLKWTSFVKLVLLYFIIVRFFVSLFLVRRCVLDSSQQVYSSAHFTASVQL